MPPPPPNPQPSPQPPSTPPAVPSTPARPLILHRAVRIENAVHRLVARWLYRRGWLPSVLPYTGYGSTTGPDGEPEGWVRVLGRVLLCPPGTHDHNLTGRRGWRRFLSAWASDIEVEVDTGATGDRRSTRVTSGLGGYLDVVLPCDLPAGRHELTLTTGTSSTRAPVFVVGPQTTVGLVSDIDDTVLVTAMPRPLLAFWNTFVLPEAARRPVPGMARLYQEITDEFPETFVVYLSTGAWNVAPALSQFLTRYGFPPGPLLMTDWGPTADAWFRSGREHKRSQLTRLLRELPGLNWLLVGDDGQHDPVLYREAAQASPDRVRAIAVRQLSATEQVLTHGTPVPLPDAEGPGAADVTDGDRVPELRAPHGQGLLAALRAAGVLGASGTTSPGPGRPTP